MTGANYVGRIGGLAVALGVGAAVFTSHGAAWAAPDTSTSTASSEGSSETGSVSDSGSPTGSSAEGSARQDVSEDDSDDAPEGEGADDAAAGEGADDDATEGDGADEAAVGDNAQDPAEGGSAQDARDSVEDESAQEVPEDDSTSQADATPQSGSDPSSATSTDEIPSSPASSVAWTNSGSDAAYEAEAETPSTAPAEPDPSVDLPGTAAAPSSEAAAQGSLAAPSAQSAVVATQPATPTTEGSAPSFSTRVATLVNRILNPFAGDTPVSPLGDPFSPSVLLAAWQRDRANSAAALASPGPTFIPTLLANGDTITPSTDYPLTVTGIYNSSTPPPGVNQHLQGYQKFELEDADGEIGSFFGYVGYAPYLNSVSESIVANQLIYADSGVADLLGVPAGAAALSDGSVISTTTFFGGAFVNVYSAIASPDGNRENDEVTNIFTNTLTGETLDLSWIVNLMRFNAADVPNVLPSYIRGVGNPTVTAISGIPPITIAVQGYQDFEYLNDDGTIGNFRGLVTPTTDIVDFHTQAILVVESDAGAYAPPVGTVYNTVRHGNLANVYSSVPQEDGTTEITNVVVNYKTGKVFFDLSHLFQEGANASAGLTDPTGPAKPFSLGDYTISPANDNSLRYTGINGLPPGNGFFQESQVFTVMDGDDPAGSFHAEVATIPTMPLSPQGQTLLVTESSSSAVPAGSMFDIRSLGYGFELMYADIVGAGDGGQNLVTNTLVTPLGIDLDISWLLPPFDASIGLDPSEGRVSYTNEPWLDLIYPSDVLV